MTTWTNNDVQDDADLILDFDTAEAKPDSFEVLPDGDYPILIKKVETKPTKAGTGKIVSAHLVITDGDGKGRVIFDGFNVVNPSEKAQLIGRKQLAGLLAAIGKTGERDMSKVVQCEAVAVVRTQAAQDGYEAKNIVRRYKPLPGADVGTPSTNGSDEQPQKKKPDFLNKPPQLAR